jgi:hypothetical protein
VSRNRRRCSAPLHLNPRSVTGFNPRHDDTIASCNEPQVWHHMDEGRPSPSPSPIAPGMNYLATITHFSLDTRRRWLHPWSSLGMGILACLETLQSPRTLATHTPFSLLPKSIASSGCRVVYMCREPKDAFVSRWHFDNKIYRGHNMDLDASFTPSASTPKAFRPTVHFGTTILSIGRRAYVANPDNQGSLPQVLRGHDLRACQACCKASLQCSLVSHSASRSKEMGYQRRW